VSIEPRVERVKFSTLEIAHEIGDRRTTVLWRT